MVTVKVTGEYKINASRDQVWLALNDPDMLEVCIPGCEALDQVGDNEFKARINTVIGPVHALFDTRLTLANLTPPESYSLSGKSKAGAAGFAKGSADVHLSEEGTGTLLRYEGDFEVGGKLAQVGSRLVASATRKTADEFFGQLSRQLDPATQRFEIEEEEGHEVANIAMQIARVGRAIIIAIAALVVLLVVRFLLG